jgi:CO dehydrogenase nickel-insertion accessory protein CooC1
MTNNEIEILAQKIAKLVINNLHEGLISGLNEWEPDQEEELLAELAKCMTLLDKYLKAEDYEKCDLLQKKIKTIETKLNNL